MGVSTVDTPSISPPTGCLQRVPSNRTATACSCCLSTIRRQPLVPLPSLGDATSTAFPFHLFRLQILQYLLHHHSCRRKTRGEDLAMTVPNRRASSLQTHISAAPSLHSMFSGRSHNRFSSAKVGHGAAAEASATDGEIIAFCKGIQEIFLFSSLHRQQQKRVFIEPSLAQILSRTRPKHRKN